MPATGCRTPGRPVRPAGCHSLPVHRRTNYKSSQWARLRKATSKSQNGWNYHLSMGLKLMLTTTHNGTEREPSLFFGVMGRSGGGGSPAKNRKNWAPIFRHSSHSSNYCHHHPYHRHPALGVLNVWAFFCPSTLFICLKSRVRAKIIKKNATIMESRWGKKCCPKLQILHVKCMLNGCDFKGFFFVPAPIQELVPCVHFWCATTLIDSIMQWYAPEGEMWVNWNCWKTTRFFILVVCVVSADYCHEFGYTTSSSGNKLWLKCFNKKLW